MKNSILLVDTDYFFGDRSIDIYLVKSLLMLGSSKIVYIYNYNSYHFRLFTRTIDMMRFFEGDDNVVPLEFDNMDSAFEYLENLNF
jgi:hypothetical protein